MQYFSHTMEEHESLTNSERDNMRAYLKSFLSSHPAHAPFSIRALDWAEATFIRSATGERFAYGKLAGASLVLILFTGMGTSYAAQNALPGQALYGVKVNLNEVVEGAFALSPVARAEFDAELTTRRLEEAEVLAAANQLTPEVSSELQTRINESASSFNGNIALLAQNEDGLSAAADVQSDLEATLSAHANVLAAITATIPETKVALAPIISTVETHVASARQARDDDTALAAATLSVATAGEETADEPARVKAAKKKASAQEAVGKVRTLATEVSGNASTSAPIARRAQQVEEVAEQGEQYLNSGDYERAADSFETAIRAATQTQVEAAVSLELQKILPTLPIIDGNGSTTASLDTDTIAPMAEPRDE